MSRLTAFRRGAAAAGATGLIALSLAGPTWARPDPGTGELPHCTSGCFEGGKTPTNGPTPPFTADNKGVGYLQLGAGVLAGLALGAGVGVISRNSHAHASHAA